MTRRDNPMKGDTFTEDWFRITDRDGERVHFEGTWSDCVRVWNELECDPDLHSCDVRLRQYQGKGKVAVWWREVPITPARNLPPEANA